jgi:mevalonate kinase
MKKINDTKITVTACAPGKIILSGEHSVVYGKPALALAVNYFVKTTVSQVSDDKIHFEFLNDKTKNSITLHELQSLKTKIDKRYQNFIAGKCSIKDVIHNPMESLKYAFIYMVDNLPLIIKNGLKIQTQSSIPIGCGMGASAAMIVSLMHALAAYFDHTITADKYLYFGREIENLQHGKSSGLDLFLSIHGGCHIFINGTPHKRQLPDTSFVLVNTGKPLSSTGECVEKAAKLFRNRDVATEFAVITMEMDSALRQNDLVATQKCIHKNHELLKYIGVVPTKVANFITEVEERGNAAKTCGAGAIFGDNAGVVLTLGNNEILDIVKKYGYEILSAHGEPNGLQIL